MSTPNSLKNRVLRISRLIAGFIVLGGLFLSLAVLAPIPARITPPTPLNDPVTVWVIGYPVTPLFYHNSLMLPNGSGQWREYSFGDRAVYANNQGRLINLAQAVLYPTPAAFGRQTFDSPHWQQRQQRSRDGGQRLRLQVERSRVQELLQQLDQRYHAAGVTPQYNPKVDLYFVPDEQYYAGWQTCNHLVARWLRQLDCQIRGWVFSGQFKLN